MIIDIILVLMSMQVVFLWLFSFYINKNWKTANGLIIESFSKGFSDGEEDETFKVFVNYKFIVNNETIYSDRISPFTRFYNFTFKPDVKLLKKYSVGTKVNILYSPTKPSNSFLDLCTYRTRFTLSMLFAIGVVSSIRYFIGQ